jgi:hypothetical protein
MNSWDKHIPKLVFAFGLLLLIAALFVFFGGRPEKPSASSDLPPPAVELSGTLRQKLNERPWMSLPPAAESKPRLSNPEPIEGPLFKNHLRAVGLTMRQPERMVFAETRARGLNVLVGTGQSGQPELILFSGRGKWKPNKTKATLEEQFRHDGLRAKEISKMNSRGGLGTMTVVKGLIRDFDEFQAFAFYAERPKVSHILVLIGRDLSKHPASVRQVIDSISVSR